MRDPKKEQLLNELGFAWEFREGYDIARIDWVEAEENHARLGVKLDMDIVVSYGEAMEQGADWTAITVRESSERGDDQLIDGRHTCAAMKVTKPERKTCDAYVIREHDPYRIDMLIRVGNVGNGRHVSVSERLLHISEMRRLFPHSTIKELGLRFRLKAKTVADYLKVLEAERRAETCGVGHIVRSARGVFGMELKRQLNALPNDQVFVRAVQLIAKHPIELRGQAATEFVQAVKDASGSERRALQLIETRALEIGQAAEERAVKKSRTPSTRMTLFMGAVRRTERQYPGSVEKLYMEGLTCPQLKRERRVVEQLLDILMDTRDRMSALIEELDKNDKWKQERPGKRPSEPT